MTNWTYGTWLNVTGSLTMQDWVVDGLGAYGDDEHYDIAGLTAAYRAEIDALLLAHGGGVMLLGGQDIIADADYDGDPTEIVREIVKGGEIDFYALAEKYEREGAEF